MENKNTSIKSNFLFKIYLYLKNKFDPPKPPKEEESYCIKICEELIKMSDSKLYYSPISQKRYIRNESKDMFIVIENISINLINHVYSYNVYLETGNIYSKLVDKFDNELENRRQILEEEIKNNIKHSLQKILNRLSD